MVQSWERWSFKPLNIWVIKEDRRDGKKDWDIVNDAKLWGIVSNQGAFEKRILLYTKHTGYYLSVRGTSVTGTEISGGLAITCHNEIREKIIHLTIKPSPHNCVHDESLIHHGRIISEGGGAPWREHSINMG